MKNRILLLNETCKTKLHISFPLTNPFTFERDNFAFHDWSCCIIHIINCFIKFKII